MAYISKIKLPDNETVYEILADKNSAKEALATEKYTDNAVLNGRTVITLRSWTSSDI